MVWNASAYRVLNAPLDEHPDASLRLAELESQHGLRLPAAVREWFAIGADELLAQRSDNLVSRAVTLSCSECVNYLRSGHLLLEIDSQDCCRWVTPVQGAGADPPVYLVGPNDLTCESPTLYAERFSSYVHASTWDASVWHAEQVSADFDHSLNDGALVWLRTRLSELPTTFAWAHNQECEAVYRFDGAAQVAVAVRGEIAAWSVVVTQSPVLRSSIAKAVGAAL